MPVYFDVLLEASSDPAGERPYASMSDAEFMQLLIAVANCPLRPDAPEVQRELWYRLRNAGLGWICRYCAYEGISVLNAAWLFCIKDLKESPQTAAQSELRAFMFKRIYRAMGRTIRGIRKNNLLKELSFDPAAPDESEEPTPEEILENEKLRAAVMDELDSLPEPLRGCFQAHVMEGVSLRALTEKHGLSLHKVRKTIGEARELLWQGLASKGFKVSATTMMMVLICEAGQAGQPQFDRLMDAGTAILNGRPIPAGSLTPATEALYLGTAKPAVVSSWAWWFGGLSAIAVPGVVACSFWGFADSKDAPASVTAQEPVATPAEPARPAQREPVAAVPPVTATASRFPADPVPGQVHVAEFPELGTTIDFCWVPGDGAAVPGLWVGRTEVAQRLWKAVGVRVADAPDPSNPSWYLGDDLPVEQVTLDDVTAFLNLFAERTGVAIRLPTGAEWRQAAAAGESGPIASPPAAELDALAWHSGNSEFKTHPVGMKRPNPYNLCDLYGNVFEMSVSAADEFQIHGGCWSYDGTWCHPASSSLWPPAEKKSGIGFRIVHDPRQP